VKQAVHTHGADLCVEPFGDQSDPAVLLVGGATAAMDWWREEFCRRLADGGRFVIRYDLRDTGESTTSKPGAPDYSARDLLADMPAILDGFGIGRAHIAGVSMGGGFAQWLALEHPDRVALLTLIATSPGPAPDLPPMSEELAATFNDPPPQPDWSDRDQAIEAIVDSHRPYNGTLPFDEAEVRAVATAVVDRSKDIEASMTNHWLIADDGEPLRPRLGAIRAPTLVLHGTADPLFPLGHGEALAREIPGARLVALEGMGHEYPPPPLWDQVIAEILALASAGIPKLK
jgi:pimeloyl-ACP methyl ester carboxylesterase